MDAAPVAAGRAITNLGGRPGPGALVASMFVSSENRPPEHTPPDDTYWRRPEAGAGEGDGVPGPHADAGTAGTAADPAGPATPPPPGYTGPPAMAPPPPGWRPPSVVQPPPPRSLPAQNHDSIDAAEREARTVTYGTGLLVGAVLLVVMCALCSRLIF